MRTNLQERVISCVSEALAINHDAIRFTPDTPLIGNLPEFDSQSVVTILTSIEQEFEITIEDEHVSAEIFADIRSLVAFVGGYTD